MKRYVKNYDEFSNYYSIILEKLSEDIFDIPGISGLSAQLRLDNIEVITTNSKVFTINLQELKEFSEGDELNLDPYFLKGLEDIYQEMVKSRYSNDLTYKLKSIKNSENYELFNISENGFFIDINKDLEFFGAKPENIIEIRQNLYKLYDSNATDGLNPNSVKILNNYLNSIIEFIAAKIYTYFKYIGQEKLIFEPTPNYNYDDAGTKIAESEKYFAFDGGLVRSENDLDPLPKANYKSCLNDLSLIVNRAVSDLNIKVSEPIDYFTNREADSTSIYVYFKLENSNFIIKSILSPVEMKRLGFERYPFWIETIDKSYILQEPCYSSSDLKKQLEITLF